MPIIERLKPETLHRPQGFAHAVIAEGARTAYIGGQIALDLAGEVLHPNDHTKQAEIAVLNVVHAVEAAGATHADITRLGVYIAGYTAKTGEQVFDGLARACSASGLRMPTMLVVGVTALAVEGIVVEIDAVAQF